MGHTPNFPLIPTFPTFSDNRLRTKGNGAPLHFPVIPFFPFSFPMLSRIFSRENLIALALCLLLAALVIVTADSAPQWIYQGF